MQLFYQWPPIGTLMQLDLAGVPLDTLPNNLRHRIEFFGFKQSLISLDVGSLPQLLVSFDELSNTWAEYADPRGVPTLQWMTWRYKIVMQMGLDMLRVYLGLPADHEAFVRPDTIKMPVKFDFIQYKQDLELMLAESNQSGQKHTVAAKAERATADMVLKALLDIQNDKNQLFKYKLYCIFNGHTLAILKRELSAFVAEIESLVLEEPKMLRPPHMVAAAMSAGNNTQWSLQDRETKGPYSNSKPAAVVETPKRAASASSSSEAAGPSAAVGSAKLSSGSRASPAEVVEVAARGGTKRTRAMTKKKEEEEEEEEESEEEEPIRKPKRGRPFSRKAVEPVTEAYTQLDAGFGGEMEASQEIALSQETEEEEKEAAGRVTRGKAGTVAKVLRSAREEYKKKHRDSDPLRSVLGDSPSPVVSHALRRGKKPPASPEEESQDSTPSKPASSKKKSPLKKSRSSIIEPRVSAEEVMLCTMLS
jgi:hypothetical protein